MTASVLASEISQDLTIPQENSEYDQTAHNTLQARNNSEKLERMPNIISQITATSMTRNARQM